MRHAKKKSRKKYLWLISLVIAAICFFVWKNNFNSNRMPSNYHADQVDLNVKAAVAINAKDGSTIYAKNANQSLPIASMTKLLTVYLTLQAIKEKKISWDTTVTPTQEIVDLGSNPDYASVPLRLGQKYTVRELYYAALIKSANNAARLLAIAVSGSETNFLNQMSQQARKWKLNNAKFVTVGSGGVAGTGPGGSGGDGGNTSFGDLLVCPGGRGSTQVQQVPPFSGGSATEAPIPTGKGILFHSVSRSNLCGALGLGDDQAIGIESITTTMLGTYGIGGTGKYNKASSGPATGNNGNQGYILVWEYQ